MEEEHAIIRVRDHGMLNLKSQSGGGSEFITSIPY